MLINIEELKSNDVEYMLLDTIYSEDQHYPIRRDYFKDFASADLCESAKEISQEDINKKHLKPIRGGKFRSIQHKKSEKHFIDTAEIFHVYGGTNGYNAGHWWGTPRE